MNVCQGFPGGNVLLEWIEGQGLGLYIARYIVRSHHGEITINIADDNIFSVILSLPR